MSTDACFTGVLHEGKTSGRFLNINGIETYSSANGRHDRKKAIVLHMYGCFWHPVECKTSNCLEGGASHGRAQNNKLLADSFAANGFAAYVPDLFAGDAAPSDPAKWIDRPAWFERHGPEQVTPILDKIFAGLREQGIEEFACIGYCFGAREVVTYAVAKKIKCAAIAHPSRVEWDKALEDLEKAETPILINSCEMDEQFPKERQEQADQKLGHKDFYKRTYAAGCSHGFAVRGDLSRPEVRKGKEEAFEAQIDWLKKYL